MDTHPHKGMFLTASRDSTVKFWSLSLGSGGLHNPITYRGHKQPVFDVRLLVS